MTQKFLHGTYVVSGFEQVRRERMAEGVAAHPLRDSSTLTGRGDRPLKDSRMEMVRASLPGGRMPMFTGGGE